MTAPATVLHVPAGVGIDQSTRPEHVPPGQANLNAQNVRVNEIGGLEKRQGLTALTTSRLGGTTRSAGLRVVPFRDSIVVSDGEILDVYSPGATAWTMRGRLPACDVKRTGVSSMTLRSSNNNANLVDIAYGSSFYLVVSAEESNGTALILSAQIVDATTKAVVYASIIDTITSSGSTVPALKASISGTSAAVFWVDGTNLKGRVLSLSAIASGFATAVTVAADVSSSTLSMDVISLSARFAVAYKNSLGGTTRVSVKTLTPSTLATIVTATPTTSSVSITSLALAGTDGEVLWVAYGQSGSGVVYVLAVDATTIGTTTVAESTAFTCESSSAYPLAMGRTAANEVYIAAGCLDNAANSAGLSGSWSVTETARVTNSSGTAVIDRSIPSIKGWIPHSTPFVYNSRVYMELSYDRSRYFSNVVMVDITGDASDNVTVRPVAMTAPRLNRTAWTISDGTSVTRHIAAKSASVFAGVYVVGTSATSASLCIAEYDFASTAKHQMLAFADGLYISGGLLYRFDGYRVFEDSFIVPPRIALLSTGTGITGTFSYTAIDEFTDSMGNVILGPPSTVETVTVSNKTVQVYFRRTQVTWKDGNDSNSLLEPGERRRVVTKIYRTTNGGSLFYLHSSISTAPDSATTYISDSTTDASLTSAATMYKHPGLVGTAKDRQSMGGVRGLVECNGVLVAIAEDGSTLRCFAQRVVGESPWHHDTLQIPIDGNGDVVALAALDGSIVAFKRDAIYVVPIEPANDTVTQGGFGFPRRVAVNCGCVEPRSVLVTGLGVFFQSDRGIELLGRDFSVFYVGERIQATFASYPTVTAAVLDVRNGVVRFSLAQSGSTTVGVDVVFDLSMEQWVSVDVVRGGSNASAQAVSAAYASVSGSFRYVRLDAAGELMYEDFSSWLDRSSYWVTALWETPWLKLELQREHQFWQGVLLHERKTACGLLAEIAEDWAAYDSGDNKTWTESAIATYTRQVELRWTKRGQSFKCRFSDSAPVSVGTGQGIEFVGLSFDMAPHQGPTQGTPRLAVASRR